MSASAKPPGRVLVALNLPDAKVPLLLSKARSIVQGMSESSWFPSPDPSLAEVQAAIDDLDAAAATLSGLRPGSTVWLRYRWTVKGVTGDWSQTISIVVD